MTKIKFSVCLTIKIVQTNCNYGLHKMQPITPKMQNSFSPLNSMFCDVPKPLENSGGKKGARAYAPPVYRQLGPCEAAIAKRQYKCEPAELTPLFRLVKNNGINLNITKLAEYKSHHGIVLTAVANNSKAFQYASNELKNDKDFVRGMVKYYPEAFQYASDKLKNDKDFVSELGFAVKDKTLPPSSKSITE